MYDPLQASITKCMIYIKEYKKNSKFFSMYLLPMNMMLSINIYINELEIANY